MAHIYLSLDSTANARRALRNAQTYCGKLAGGEKASMLAQISGGYSGAGKKGTSKTLLKNAIKEAGNIKDTGEAINALGEIAKASHKLKDTTGEISSFDKAIKLAQESKSPTIKAVFLCQIAKAQISIGSKQAAIKTLEMAHAASKEIPVSSKDSGTEHLPHERANALMDIVELYISAKHKGPVKSLLSEANGFVEEIVKPQLETEARGRLETLKRDS